MLQVSTAAHLWLVDHVRCPKHGELIHGSAERADGLPSALTAAQTVRSAGGPEESVNCDHCSVAAERKDTAALSAPSELTDATRLADVSPAPEAIVAVWSGPLRFRIAPKNSPPA